ncbi:hypothetical protein TSA66_00500 [Noviherbaspirillum autotrophicum]|uniref:Ava_C0101 and related proteins n=1 Tax=Noviherbaspirillum autotrophicum TaxID=709839 RepID=A0A0C2BVR7_9BURK|nr:hypothetical protein TSA66_14195 [Noviherbaspirillum autotrophicum]KIF83798.1 hypothetical protein TSA66_16530 [Noviherbaspirillum autotrophicum]KIF84119.1 hypothetical protein TSA66_00500 [Noviherbaspirillum autotrophicum]
MVMPIRSLSSPTGPAGWPELPYEAWRDTCETLHMWTQIVGKIRKVQSPWVNHSWNVPLYVTAHGLTTSPIPYGNRLFQIDFDFVDHQLAIQCSDAPTEVIPLVPRSVADFYHQLFSRLSALGLDIKIHGAPNEVLNPVPFQEDTKHASYDSEAANRFWQVLAQADRVFKQFRGRFIGKCSPVHFFWGSFDLALTRFSGRRAPAFSGSVPNCPDWVMREAYSHEVCSCGFWPGSDALPLPIFYTYAYPEPAGFNTHRVMPETARYDPNFREFILPYEEVRHASSPDQMLLEFLEDAYAAAATLGKWDRQALETTEPIYHT